MQQVHDENNGMGGADLGVEVEGDEYYDEEEDGESPASIVPPNRAGTTLPMNMPP